MYSPNPEKRVTAEDMNIPPGRGRGRTPIRQYWDVEKKRKEKKWVEYF